MHAIIFRKTINVQLYSQQRELKALLKQRLLASNYKNYMLDQNQSLT
jgi:hypothetical protein